MIAQKKTEAINFYKERCKAFTANAIYLQRAMLTKASLDSLYIPT